MMRVKNHQMPPMIRVERALGISSEPGGGGGGDGTREGTCFISIIHVYTYIYNKDWVPLSNCNSYAIKASCF